MFVLSWAPGEEEEHPQPWDQPEQRRQPGHPRRKQPTGQEQHPFPRGASRAGCTRYPVVPQARGWSCSYSPAMSHFHAHILAVPLSVRAGLPTPDSCKQPRARGRQENTSELPGNGMERESRKGRNCAEALCQRRTRATPAPAGQKALNPQLGTGPIHSPWGPSTILGTPPQSLGHLHGP
ncbi:uncharacterized protein VSU04_008786 [Chlamydotis macqueenii]